MEEKLTSFSDEFHDLLRFYLAGITTLDRLNMESNRIIKEMFSFFAFDQNQLPNLAIRRLNKTIRFEGVDSDTKFALNTLAAYCSDKRLYKNRERWEP